ncbi:MAG: hypothetical protein U9N52_06875 [Campylobacterota bacterium]|nr:hypothetical protein [Campylobacterota bacterium]
MIDLNKELPNENLTQKDIMQFLLHSTQHVATREELEGVKRELKLDISKVEDKISKVDAKFDKIQWLIVATILTVLLKDYIISFIQISPTP